MQVQQGDWTPLVTDGETDAESMLGQVDLEGCGPARPQSVTHLAKLWCPYVWKSRPHLHEVCRDEVWGMRTGVNVCVCVCVHMEKCVGI